MISRQIDLTINKMTKAQYNGISPVADEVYVITDEAGCVTSVNGIQPDASGNVAITIPTVNNGTLTITQDGNTLGIFGANQSGDTTVNIPSSGSSRNIGEIVASTIPLTDAGLHLLDGALIQGAGSYSEFVDYIAGLVTDYPDLFDTEANWQSAVTQYGVCGKFVYDSVNNTVRLPKITGIVEGTTDLTALGDLVEAGLPNISGVLGPSRTLHTYSGTSVPISGAFKKTSISGTTVIGSSGSSADVYKYEIDASLSNSIYGNSTTVQPQTIKVLYYIVIATSTKTQIQVDIDEIATDLNGKADVDLSNVPTSKGILTESYVNGTSWYRVYSDGWCEQGGFQLTLSAANTMVKISLLKPYKDGNYTVVATNAGSSASAYFNVKVGSEAINETDGFYLALSSASAAAWWRTSGYIS